MATKEFVGPVDCYGALLPDEEYFLLMGRDPLMAGLTMIWACLRIGDVEGALNNFTAMADPRLVRHYLTNPDKAKSDEAVEVAQRGQAWRERNVTAGENGQPSWKSSRAAGVERFVMEYAERRPDGVTVIPVPIENWPHWLAIGYKPPKLVTIGPYEGERMIPAEDSPEDGA